MLRVAVIIPTLHDDAALAELLPRLRVLDSPPDEVIVVDGAARDDTAALCERFGACWIPGEPGRGLQLARGAARAGADILWFLHADAEPHPRALVAIRESIARGAIGGYFRFRFGGPATWIKRMLEACIAWRCRVAMVYGDQGLFVTRAAYRAGPGFAPQPLFEEVPLVRMLKRSGRFVALDLPLVVSPRRWERDGFLRRTLGNRMLAVGYLCGIAPATLARWYSRAPRGGSK